MNETAASPASLNQNGFAGLDWALFMGVSLIWGSSFLFIAVALEGLTPGVITLGRVGLGALALWIVRLATMRGEGFDRADRPRLVLLSLIWVAVPFTLFPLAQQHINSAVTGLLNGATPIFATAVSVVLIKVSPHRLQVLGIAAGFIGVTLISLGELLATNSGADSSLPGVLMVLAATVCYGFAINIAAPLQQKYGAVILMSNVLGLATIWVLPFSFVNLSDNSPNVAEVASLVFLGAIGTGAAYWIMANLVGRVGAIRASLITYLIPVVSLILGVTFRSDTVAVLSLFGAVLTIAGAAVASRGQRVR